MTLFVDNFLAFLKNNTIKNCLKMALKMALIFNQSFSLIHVSYGAFSRNYAKNNLGLDKFILFYILYINNY